MRLASLGHGWDISPKEAIAVQKELALAVSQEKPAGPIRLVAGVDAAFSADATRCLAGVVLWDVERGEVLEHHTASRPLLFPYIPGLLTFREGPAILAALRRLQRTPDVLLCDGQGIAHPRGCGIATHLGVLLDLASIGCAKSRLVGEYQMPEDARGSSSALRFKERQVGVVLRTRNRVKPVFVSVGHKMDLETAVAVILACGRGYRLPEPTRLADHLVGQAKRELAAMDGGDAFSKDPTS